MRSRCAWTHRTTNPFATTEEFLRNFGIESLDDLPVVNPEKIEDFKLEAEEEVQLELDI